MGFKSKGNMLIYVICIALTRRQIINAASTFSVLPMSTAKSVQFYGDIDIDSCQKLVSELLVLEHIEDEEPIQLHIQSYGGDLMPVFYALDCIDALKTPVWTHVDGYAASAASLLSVYGDRRFMTKRSFVLMHELRTEARGSFSEVSTDLSHSKELMQMMCDVYEMKTSMKRDEIMQLLVKDAWLNAKQCLSFGIVDRVL
jgi:ATP-dependent protease ClpP protease subunit